MADTLTKLEECLFSLDNSIDIVLHEEYPKYRPINALNISEKENITCEMLAKKGQLEILKLLYAKGRVPTRTYCMIGAAIGGQIKIIQWLDSIPNYGLNMDMIYEYAIGHDQLDFLKELKTNGYAFPSNACARAITNDKLHILKWLLETGCDWGACKTTKFGVENPTLIWARENGLPIVSFE